jgi:hypothetical protein
LAASSSILRSASSRLSTCRQAGSSKVAGKECVSEPCSTSLFQTASIQASHLLRGI